VPGDNVGWLTLLDPQEHMGGMTMKWHTPKIVEICVALEINDYVPAEL
jgi:coenzyme PQQ precursor peptide PqqA